MATIRNSINDASTGLDIVDDTDPTKVLTFDVSGITTSTTRTWTADDRSIDFDAVPTSIETASGTCTPASGSFTITGSGVSTSASGSTITITGSAGGFLPWTLVSSGSPYTLSVNNGYILTNTATNPFVFTLPSTSAVGDVIRIIESKTSSPNGSEIRQNAGQYIRMYNDVTTTGTGGYLSINVAVSVPLELICVTANTAWQALSYNSNWVII